jgi:putative transcription factor
MVSFCELCGKQAESRIKIMAENTVFNVCLACSKRGKPMDSVPSSSLRAIHGRNTNISGKTGSQLSPSSSSSSKPSSYPNRMRPMPRNKPPPQKKINLTDEIILDPEFPKVVRDARNKKGITHEQLGQKINEKVTLLKKVETGTIKPDDILSKKLERFLGIKLYINSNEGEGEMSTE